MRSSKDYKEASKIPLDKFFNVCKPIKWKKIFFIASVQYVRVTYFPELFISSRFPPLGGISTRKKVDLVCQSRLSVSLFPLHLLRSSLFFFCVFRYIFCDHLYFKLNIKVFLNFARRSNLSFRKARNGNLVFDESSSNIEKQFQNRS